jgi:hypothetical protein
MAVLKEIVRKGLPPQTHAYDAPNISPLQFLSEVMHAKHLPLDTRIKAASALLPYTNSFPRSVVQGPTITIVIGGLKDPEQIVGETQSFSVSANNSHQPRCGAPPPSNTETDSTPPKPRPFLSTPGQSFIEHTLSLLSIDEIIKISANVPEHLLPMCPCGHRMMYPCAAPCRPVTEH